MAIFDSKFRYRSGSGSFTTRLGNHLRLLVRGLQIQKDRSVFLGAVEVKSHFLKMITLDHASLNKYLIVLKI